MFIRFNCPAARTFEGRKWDNALARGSTQPRRIAGFGQAGELLAIPLGVHARPETAVLVNVELFVTSQAHERFALQHAGFVLAQILEEIPMEEEIPAIDPVVLDVRLFGKLKDLVVLNLDFAEAGGRIDAQHGAKLRM